MTNTPLFPFAVAALCTVAIWPLAGVAAPGRSAQRIQIDPDSGEIVTPSDDAPPQSAAGDTQQPRQRARSASPDGPRSWRTEDGVEMVTPDPDDAPTTQATACPDGSLHIGEAEPEEGEGAPQAQCGEDN